MINRQNLHGKIMKGEILQIGHSLLLWHQQPLHNFGHFILKSSRCFLIESFDANKILASALYKKHGSQEMAISSHCQQILLATLRWCSFYVLGFVCFCEWFWVLQRMDGSWPKTPNINFHHRNENAKNVWKRNHHSYPWVYNVVVLFLRFCFGGFFSPILLLGLNGSEMKINNHSRRLLSSRILAEFA